MDNKNIAKEFLKAAKDLMSIEFDSEDALKKYLKEHPDADKSKHKVKKTNKPIPRKQKEKLEDLNKHAESGNTEMVKYTIQSLKNDINLNDVTPEQAEVLKEEISKAREILTNKQQKTPTLPKNDVLHKKVPVSKGTLKKVNNVLKSNDIDKDSDELQEMTGFKKTLGQRVPEQDKGKWYVRNEQKLKKDFIKNMDPSNYSSPEAFKNARQRIMDMPTSDFGKVLAAIGEEDEE